MNLRKTEQILEKTEQILEKNWAKFRKKTEPTGGSATKNLQKVLKKKPALGLWT